MLPQISLTILVHNLHFSFSLLLSFCKLPLFGYPLKNAFDSISGVQSDAAARDFLNRFPLPAIIRLASISLLLSVFPFPSILFFFFGLTFTACLFGQYTYFCVETRTWCWTLVFSCVSILCDWSFAFSFAFYFLFSIGWKVGGLKAWKFSLVIAHKTTHVKLSDFVSETCDI